MTIHRKIRLMTTKEITDDNNNTHYKWISLCVFECWWVCVCVLVLMLMDNL